MRKLSVCFVVGVDVCFIGFRLCSVKSVSGRTVSGCSGGSGSGQVKCFWIFFFSFLFQDTAWVSVPVDSVRFFLVWHLDLVLFFQFLQF